MTSYSDLSKCRKKYNVILADPPWDFKHRGKPGIRAAASHYKVEPVTNIMQMPVSNIVADNAVLFLWCTWPFYKEALDVMNAWGFEFKTCAFLWEKMGINGKDKVGMGFWTRSNTEYVLLGTTPKNKLRRKRSDVRQIYRSIPKRHSQKPDEFRQRIIRLMGDLPRIELFARQNLDNQGWDTFGNDPALKLRSLK